ncbi:2Fe-2S iron-sulfur cluster-binding protein [Streptomyces sp. NBC_01363]|uniref:2Fe-2S iron-sulfur cluster-binding protein n=1 Tax=Streptomyces sp. NBC_01363 TaxID=2903840 RepID=UPI0022536ECC|nr:2Fe-2S iron-sulfur cluster-binding protein [Streptomyces sp. NBC_01363]MCX4731783.1 2Fe-2S iron-sulfur cluster-binding protein [Streptomyces sp. NBC_01363]
MSNEDHNEQHGQQEHLQHGSWQPTPQGGEYDDGATAFVHLPPEDLANIPLAAPGQGYVPPMILPLTPAAGLDPSATGSWVVQTQSQQERGTAAEQPAPGTVHWPDPNQQQGPYDYGYEYQQSPDAPQVPQTPQAPQTPHDPFSQEQYRETPAATGQWNFTESTEFGVHTGQAGQTGQADHAGHAGNASNAGNAGQADQADHTGHATHANHSNHSNHDGHTGQWTIPVADGDLPEESGEFAASALAAQWYGDRTPPATLPGGAPAPWATQQPASEPGPEPELVAEPAPPADIEPEHAPGVEFEQAAEAAQAPEAAPDTEPVGDGSVSVPEADLAQETAPAIAPDTAPATAAGEAPSEHPAEAAPEPYPAGQPPETALDESHDVAADAATDTESPESGPPATDSPESQPADSRPADSPPVESGPVETEPVETEPVESEPSVETGRADSEPADSEQADTGLLGAPSEHPAASYVLHVNGADRPVTDAWIGESLLYVLRERLGLAGAKDGCSQGECGACNVQVDGRLVASCLVPAATAAGSEVRTVEGLAVDGEPSDVQRALAKCGAVQCGFCIPGMAMTVHDLLEGNHAPSELETRQALCGNLCRCSGYRGVLDAVNEVVAGREATTDPASSDSTSPEPDEARIPHQAAPGAGSVQSHPQDGGMA